MILLDRTHLNVSAGTHPGRKGKNNEDRYGVSAYQVSEEDLTPSLLAVIADGVGGHRAGEVAAEMAVEIVSHVVAESNAKDPERILADAIHQANQAITTRAQSSPDFLGMGTTCACTWILGDRLYITSVGDSRVYLIRDGEIKQITIDHTWIQEAIESGALSPEQARGHPNAHVIRRHLGTQKIVVPDFRMRLEPAESDTQSESNQGMQLHPDDQLLMCSDGLTEMVSDAEIFRILSKKHGDEVVDDLLALANEHGGHDNITAIVIRVPETGFDHVVSEKPKRSLLVWGLVATAVVICVVMIIIGGYYWAQSRGDVTSVPTNSFIIEATSDREEQQILSPTDVLQHNIPLTPGNATPNSITPLTPTMDNNTPMATYTPWPTSTVVPTEVNR
jgi:protein phosphatase